MQHTLQTIFGLADVPGTANIANDILIFAENTKKDEERLEQVLERCKCKGITLNLEKSVFGKKKLKCYGSMFNEKGTKAGLEKMQEAQNTQASERTKKALQIVLGLTNYMKRFIHDFSIEK